MDPFDSWFVVSGEATPDGIRVVRLVLGAIRSLWVNVGVVVVLGGAVVFSSEFGTHETVKARSWPCLSGKSSQNLVSCSLFARKRSEYIEREFFVDNLMVQVHCITEMIWWTGLTP